MSVLGAGLKLGAMGLSPELTVAEFVASHWRVVAAGILAVAGYAYIETLKGERDSARADNVHLREEDARARTRLVLANATFEARAAAAGQAAIQSEAEENAAEKPVVADSVTRLVRGCTPADRLRLPQATAGAPAPAAPAAVPRAGGAGGGDDGLVYGHTPAEIIAHDLPACAENTAALRACQAERLAVSRIPPATSLPSR